jgi:dTDP-4-amino-4,6-dideoxygalactose transaminase
MLDAGKRRAIRTAPLPAEFPGLNFMDYLEKEAVLRVLEKRSLYRYYGPEPPSEASAFEKEFASFVNVRYALAVTSGTTALLTALAALGVGPGQEVIIPAYMWVSVAAAVVNLGAIPVVADIDDTFCIAPLSVEAHITARTRGIIAVHMNGSPAKVPSLLDISRRRGLFLLEDCSQCVGGTLGGRPVGSFGDMGTFSFQINKNMTSGEGGCVVTNDPNLNRRALAYHDLGYMRGEDGHLGVDVSDGIMWGLSCRLDELRAAILRVQLRKLPSVIWHMRRSKYRIRGALAGLPGISLRTIVDPDGDCGGFLITTYKDGITAQSVCRGLRERGFVSSNPESSAVVLADYGLHIYSNISCLARRVSIDGRGTPWTLAENSSSNVSYCKGTCPAADDLFERSVLITIPSCLSDSDESDIINGITAIIEDLQIGK